MRKNLIFFNQSSNLKQFLGTYNYCKDNLKKEASVLKDCIETEMRGRCSQCDICDVMFDKGSILQGCPL